MKIRRREFLIGSTALGAGALWSCAPLRNGLVPTPEGMIIPSEKGSWIATTCQGCTTWCPLEVFVQDDRAVKVRGNQHSRQNDGVCCPRGHIGLQQLYDPDRIKVPMKRTNPAKGRDQNPRFVPITWDEALDTIADRMMDLRQRGVPERYMLMRGRYTYMRDVIYDAMTKVFGSPNNISHSAICAEAEKFGSYFTEGLWDYRDYDLDGCRYLVAWGCDPVSSNRMVPASIRRLSGVLERGTVVAVDPRFHTTAAKAHEWMPVEPGQDGALATALAHAVLVQGMWSKEFVGDFRDGRNLFRPGQAVPEDSFDETHTHGLVRWWNLELKDRSPQWAASVAGVPAEQIERVARGMGEAAPHVAVWLGPGVGMQVRGAYSSMAVHALNGLLGSVDERGGVFAKASIPAGTMPDLGPYQDELAKKHSKLPKIDGRGTLLFPSLKKGKSGGGVVTNNAADGILEDVPYPIEVAIGYMNNFVFANNGAERWERAMAKIPFSAHITTHASETTWFADVVLPSTTTTFEKWGFLKSKANRYACLSLLQPVVKPLWDVRTDETEIPWLIAERLAKRGFDDLIRYYRTEFKDPETGAEPADAAQFAVSSVKYYTAPVWSGDGAGSGDVIKGWKEFCQRGMWNSDAYPYRKRWDEFKTKTHRFEFYSETLRDALSKHAEKHGSDVDGVLAATSYLARGEQAFVPHYEEPLRIGDSETYPLMFLDYKSRLNSEGRSQNSRWYMEFKKMDPGDLSWKDVLKVNPRDATKAGLKDGDRARLVAPHGSWEVDVHLWEGIRPGTVTKCFGQGHWAYGRVARAAGRTTVNNNEVMPVEYERLSGSNARNGGFTRVRLEKV